MSSHALEKVILQTLQQDKVPWDLQPKFSIRSAVRMGGLAHRPNRCIHLQQCVMCNPVTSGCTLCILRPACVNLFTSLEASLLCLKKQSQKHTHTQTYSHQGIIYLLVGSKLILWTSIISSSQPRPVFLVRIKNRRHVRHTFTFLIAKIIFLLD